MHEMSWLVGSWQLESYINYPVGAEPPYAPLGHSPKGLIIYSPDGYMSAQLSGAESFVSYGGPYSVDLDNQVVAHHVEVASQARYVGGVQRRWFACEGGKMTLRTVDPVDIWGSPVTSILKWHKNGR